MVHPNPEAEIMHRDGLKSLINIRGGLNDLPLPLSRTIATLVQLLHEV